jgi:predicted NAD/FAD-binding protein
MRIAIVGTGVSGLVAAHRLHREHEITVFEANSYIGGLTHTLDIEDGETTIPIDTGFIVFNEKNYPRFSALLRELEIGSRESDMSFSVRNERTGLEYRGSSLNTLFAQRRNLLRPSFYAMIRDIIRFYREVPRDMDRGESQIPLGDYLQLHRYSRAFLENHIVPMTCALWSSGWRQAQEMPVGFLVRFFSNHGMMQFSGRPPWRVVAGGSREYVKSLVRPIQGRIRTSTPVTGIRRTGNGVEVRPRDEEWVSFDKAILATHSDQALRILLDPTPEEKRVLGAVRYQANEIVLHTDARFLPRRERAWSSWNYHVTREPIDLPTVTYFMNKLQGFRAKRPYLVTLNRTAEIRPESILERLTYDHPVFDRGAVAAQDGHDRINGVRDTYFAGAYWGFGFHEDGVKSGEKAVASLRRSRRAA